MPVCCDCEKDLPKASFAKSQRKKNPGKRRCLSCAEPLGGGDSSSAEKSSSPPHELEGANFTVRASLHDGRTLTGTSRLNDDALLEVDVPGLRDVLEAADPMCDGTMDEDEEGQRGLNMEEIVDFMEHGDAEFEEKAGTPSLPNFGLKQLEVVASLAAPHKGTIKLKGTPRMTNDPDGSWMLTWADFQGRADMEGYFGRLARGPDVCRLMVDSFSCVSLLFDRAECHGDYNRKNLGKHDEAEKARRMDDIMEFFFTEE